jgi:hypothetical protein
MRNLKRETSILIIAIVVMMALFAIIVLTQSTVLLLGLSVIGILIIMNIVSKSSICYVFFFILLLTEFIYIIVFEGTAHPYHFFQLVLFLFLIKYIGRITSTKQFWCLLSFTIYFLLSSLISLNVGDAIRSYMLLVLNVGISVVTAMILSSKEISITSYKNTILIISLISVVWGLIQFETKAIADINLVLSESQVKQINWNLIPSFRTEADTFSKYLLFPMMLYMPNLLYGKSTNKWIIIFYILAVLSLFINIVRSGIYGLMFGLFIVFIWSIRKRNIRKFLLIFCSIGVLVIIIIFLLFEGFLPIGEYAQSKILNIFNMSYSNIVNDYSGSYRIANLSSVLKQTFSNTHNMIWGMGWGQTYYYYGGKDVHLVVGDLFSFLGYGGIIGVILYLVLSIRTFLIFKKAASLKNHYELSLFGEGMMYAFSALFVTSLFDGYLLAPEYWMILGIGIFMEWKMNENLKKSVQLAN